MKTCKLVLTILAVFAMSAGAAEIWWGNPNQTPAGGNGDWSTPTNWGPLALPGVRDSACINQNATPYPVLSAGDYTISNLLVGYWGNGGMTINGGGLGVSNLFSVGYYGGAGTGEATFTMNDGMIGSLLTTDNDPAQLWIGYHTNNWNPTNGTLNMNGGRIDVRWAMNIGGGASNTVGHLNLSGGIIHLWQALNVASNSTITISGDGTLALWNKWGNFNTIESIQSLINSGRIVGVGGQVIITPFDNLDGGTGYALTVPEPATMTILALGLALIRRK